MGNPLPHPADENTKTEDHVREARGPVEKATRKQLILQMVSDFTKKCNEDHVGAFGAMSSFFIVMSLFPFLIFFLTIIKQTPLSKDYVIHVMVQLVSFEQKSLIQSMVNELWRKTEANVFTLSIIVALWAASRGIYSIVMGLNSVYDIDENRNYFSLRFFSLLYTIVFGILVIIIGSLWIFGNMVQALANKHIPYVGKLINFVMNQKILFTFGVLTVFFMLIYQFIPNRQSNFSKQWPGALVASIGWIIISFICSLYMNYFPNFTFLYGSMASIMILLVWLDLCMSMIFYGAEFNYFLENKKNYHRLIRVLRPSMKRQIRREQRILARKVQEERQEKKELKKEQKEQRKEQKVQKREQRAKDRAQRQEEFADSNNSKEE